MDLLNIAARNTAFSPQPADSSSIVYLFLAASFIAVAALLTLGWFIARRAKDETEDGRNVWLATMLVAAVILGGVAALGLPRLITITTDRAHWASQIDQWAKTVYGVTEINNLTPAEDLDDDNAVRYSADVIVRGETSPATIVIDDGEATLMGPDREFKRQLGQ